MQTQRSGDGYDRELSERSLDELHRDVDKTRSEIQALLARIADTIMRGQNPRPASIRGQRTFGLAPLTRRVLARYPSALIVLGLLLIGAWVHLLVWSRRPRLRGPAGHGTRVGGIP
jgi:hypothetical protein